MPTIETVKTNFSAGEISPELLGRSDLKLYQNGARTLENVFVKPTGGVTRRDGLRYVAGITGSDARLVPFNLGGANYLLVITNAQTVIYLNDVVVTTLITPWTTAQLKDIAWGQSNDDLLIVHPDVEPRKLNFNGTTWSLQTWGYNTDTVFGILYQPHFQFVDGVTIAASATTGTNITLTASGPLFQSGHVNVRFRLKGKEVRINTVTSATIATAQVIEALTGTTATGDWTEAAFSPVRGWPTSVAFHQQRLVIGGSRSLPNRLFLSKTGKTWNFNTGTGLDDEAITFSILSDQSNSIRGVFSSRHLQIFTSGGEWMATGSPLTPSSIQLQRQTKIGSVTTRFIPPVDTDGATCFIGSNGNQLREFFFNDVEGAYSATDLAVVAPHMMNGAVDQSYDPEKRLLHVVQGDGTLSTLTVYRTENVTAWSRQITNGSFKSCRVVGANTYFIVLRGPTLCLERFDGGMQVDHGVMLSNGTPKTAWTGLSHLNGKTVNVVCNNIVQDDTVIAGGVLTTPIACITLQIGLPFTLRVEPLPPNQINFASAAAMRLTDMVIRVHNTASMSVDTGLGFREIPLSGDALPAPYTYWPRVSGDVMIRAYGWVCDHALSLWYIQQDAPLPFTILSITTTMKVST